MQTAVETEEAKVSLWGVEGAELQQTRFKRGFIRNVRRMCWEAESKQHRQEERLKRQDERTSAQRGAGQVGKKWDPNRLTCQIHSCVFILVTAGYLCLIPIAY